MSLLIDARVPLSACVVVQALVITMTTLHKMAMIFLLCVERFISCPLAGVFVGSYYAEYRWLQTDAALIVGRCFADFWLW
jgi:hypothetical protein